MKKLYFLLLSACVLTSTITTAQSMTTGGETYSVEGTPDEEIIFNIVVFNTTNEDVDVHASREVVKEVPGSKNLFCWGIFCYPYTVDESTSPATIPAGGSENTFSAHFEPRGNEGIEIIKYTFSNAKDASDKSVITVTYDAAITGIEDLKNSINAFGAFPSATSGMTNIQYNLANALENKDKKIVIRSLTGQIVASQPIEGTKGAMVFNAGNFASGIYTYSLLIDNNIIQTKKLVVY